jgi:hypothetical protein
MVLTQYKSKKFVFDITSQVIVGIIGYHQIDVPLQYIKKLRKFVDVLLRINLPNAVTLLSPLVVTFGIILHTPEFKIENNDILP